MDPPCADCGSSLCMICGSPLGFYHSAKTIHYTQQAGEDKKGGGGGGGGIGDGIVLESVILVYYLKFRLECSLCSN